MLLLLLLFWERGFERGEREREKKGEGRRRNRRRREKRHFSFSVSTHHLDDVRGLRPPRRGVPQPDLAHVVARRRGECPSERRKGHGDRRHRRRRREASEVIVGSRPRRRVENGPRRLQAAQERLFRAVVSARRGRELAPGPRGSSTDGSGQQSSGQSIPSISAAQGAAASAARSHLQRHREGLSTRPGGPRRAAIQV